jgi:hypothetical protein
MHFTSGKNCTSVTNMKKCVYFCAKCLSEEEKGFTQMLKRKMKHIFYVWCIKEVGCGGMDWIELA